MEEFPSRAWGKRLGRFSVRIDRYAGGSSIGIRLPNLDKWTPKVARSIIQRVCDIGDRWEGKGFDGMTDMEYSVAATDVDGTKYRTTCYVFVTADNGCSITQRNWPHALGQNLSQEDYRELIRRYGA